MMRTIVVIGLILALICVCGASVFAVAQGFRLVEDSGVRIRLFENRTVSAEGVEEKTLQTSGPISLKVTNDFGFVNVSAADVSQVHITAEKTAWGGSQEDADAALSEIKVIVEQKGDKISVRVEQPAEMQALSIGPGSGRVDFSIEVPLETEVDLTAISGDVSLEGTRGAAKLVTSFGSLTVKNVTGKISADSTSGGIEAQNLDAGEGKINLASSFGEIDARTLKGSEITINAQSGQVTLQDIQSEGSVSLRSEFGAIQLTGGQTGPLEVNSNNGSITLEGLRVHGEVKVTSQFGDITLKNVNGESYSVESQNGKIYVDGASGKVTIDSQFGEIEVLNAENVSATFNAVNGGITFSGSLGNGPHVFESNYGNVSLSLPEDTAVDIDLQTEFGSISSEFEMTIKGQIEEKHWQGKINGGGAELTVSTNNGNIELTISQ